MSVWLVISSYRNDEDVMRILSQVHECSNHEVVDKILVVDSESTGAIPKLIEGKCWDDVIYKSYDSNLGSGANLCERLRIAAEAGADYAYALNHDGHFDVRIASALLKAVGPLKNLGAAYPLSYLTCAGAYNLTGTRELPLPAKLTSSRPAESLIDVFWSSSNGALYSLEPVRKGIVPWSLMWMGWEDLEYGWRLSTHGYRQVIVCEAIYADNYEYKKAWFGKTVDKPVWRTYYYARNLIFAIRRSRSKLLYFAVAAYRLLLELGLIIGVRNCKWQRTNLLFRGAADGLRNTIDISGEIEKGEHFGLRSSPPSTDP